MTYKKYHFIFIPVLVLFLILSITPSGMASQENFRLDSNISKEIFSENKQILKLHNQQKLFIPEFKVKGIYVTGWVAGISKRMNHLIKLVEDTEINSMVIDVKDDLGYLSYKSNVNKAINIKANKNKIKNISSLLNKLDKKGIYTIARIVVFKDAVLANSNPELALNINKKINKKNKTNINEDIDFNGKKSLNKKSDDDSNRDLNPSIKKDRNKNKSKLVTYKSKSWVNPANAEVWNYNIQLAREALNLGFDEVQFDYIRFPALHNNQYAVYNREQSKQKIINDFIATAYNRLSDIDKPISIDVFGLTTSVSNDLGIGQNFSQLSQYASIISPMVYPSHYSPGVYGLDIPEKNPHDIVYQSMIDAKNKTSNKVQIRPWLQDFTLNYKYSVSEVKAQINAVESMGVKEWLLWNPRSKYTREALKKVRK